MVQVEVYTTSNKKLGDITIESNTKVKDIKKQIVKIRPNLYVERQSIRDQKGKDITDESTVPDITKTLKVYVKDLGPQVGWSTVFISEYAGPLILYAFTAFRPWIIYGTVTDDQSFTFISKVALVCWSVHYAKRILETLFVHRFSHGTMPLRNLFRNCAYYWLFALYVAYHVNHPLYTAPCFVFQAFGFLLFTIGELGNFSTHLLLSNLRPKGSKVRKIPLPNSNVLTKMFNFVSCPNYTYEVMAWTGFTIMTFCLPAGFFTLAGFYQMTVWAIAKHRNYKKEFKDYPKNRKAIIPFVI